MSIERFANNSFTTLNGSITNSATSITVSGHSTFPSSAQFRIKIDNEIMIVTGGAGTNTWTVTRGAEGTIARSHADGAIVKHVLTAGSLIKTFEDRINSGLLANRPAAGVPKRVYIARDGRGIDVDDGSVWNTLTGLTVSKTPVLSNFPFWVNQGSATATQTNHSIDFFMPNSDNDQLRFIAKAPSTSPIDVTISFQSLLNAITFNAAGMFLYNSNDNRILSFMQEFNNTVTYKRWNSVTSYNSEPNINMRGISFGAQMYLRYQEDATTRYFSLSIDNINWRTLHSESNTTFLTVDRIGIGMQMNGAGGNTAFTKFVHFEER
jgi:hypothetical protein